LVKSLGAKALRDIDRKAIISGDWYRFEEFDQETRLPSTFRAWLYIRKCFRLHGIRALPAPPYGY